MIKMIGTAAFAVMFAMACTMSTPSLAQSDDDSCIDVAPRECIDTSSPSGESDNGEPGSATAITMSIIDPHCFDSCLREGHSGELCTVRCLQTFMESRPILEMYKGRYEFIQTDKGIVACNTETGKCRLEVAKDQ